MQQGQSKAQKSMIVGSPSKKKLQPLADLEHLQQQHEPSSILDATVQPQTWPSGRISVPGCCNTVLFEAIS